MAAPVVIPAMLNRFAFLFVTALLVATDTVAVAQVLTKPSRIRGEIVSISGNTMTVHRKGGTPGDTVSIELLPDLTVSTVKVLRLQDIASGSFVGATSTPDASGRLIASEVHVIPEAARGSGEGHYAWDVTPRSTMTNANVDMVVIASEGRELQLSYRGGKKTISVPEGTPIVTGAPASRDDLKAGKYVFLSASQQADGKLAALRVVVEKDGVLPPF